MEYEFLHNFSKPKQNPNIQLRQKYQKKKKKTPPSPALTQNNDHLKNQNLPILLNDNSQYFCSGH